MRTTWLVRISVAIALIGSLAFTPVRVRVTVDVSVDGSAQEAAHVISTAILDRGCELVTSPSGASWYVIKETSVSVSLNDHWVVIEASRMRGAGCSSKSLRRDEDEVFAMLDQFIIEVSGNTGIAMRPTRRKAPNQVPEPTSGLAPGRGSS